MKRTTDSDTLANQIKRVAKEGIKPKEEFDGSFTHKISTGSTLLDLAISGGRVRGGGLPGGVLVEIFGPNGSGKTVLLSEIGGDIQRKGGELKFDDPEARLNQQFAKMFGLDLKPENYNRPETVTDVFKTLREWDPPKTDVIHGIMTDSLAALSTDLEMKSEDGDKMGARRAKEFSEELRRTCRLLAEKNYLMCCSNQIRENFDAGPYGSKFEAPGGKAIGFYASLRLRTSIFKKIKKDKTYNGKAVSKIVGVEIEVEVFKNSIWKPYRTAPVTIIFDYGVDDIQQNLQFIKKYSSSTVYTVGEKSLGPSMDKAIDKVEAEGLETELQEEVINLWEKIESQFDSERKPKR